MGAFIGDALGLGPHWYYDLSELRRDYDDWITGYTDPKPDRYHAGLKAGQLSQSGFILKLMVRSLVGCGGYDTEDFCHRMDEELFPLLDGTPVNGPGGYTSQSIRETWRRRVQQMLPWGRRVAMRIRPRQWSVHLQLLFVMHTSRSSLLRRFQLIQRLLRQMKQSFR